MYLENIFENMSRFSIKCVTVLYRPDQFRPFTLITKKRLKVQVSKNQPKVEEQKIIAERVNGWAAMMGFWAAVGAYLTTGQIIPGVV